MLTAKNQTFHALGLCFSVFIFYIHINSCTPVIYVVVIRFQTILYVHNFHTSPKNFPVLIGKKKIHLPQTIYHRPPSLQPHSISTEMNKNIKLSLFFCKAQIHCEMFEMKILIRIGNTMMDITHTINITSAQN